jgi:hypothetical protein
MPKAGRSADDTLTVARIKSIRVQVVLKINRCSRHGNRRTQSTRNSEGAEVAGPIARRPCRAYHNSLPDRNAIMEGLFVTAVSLRLGQPVRRTWIGIQYRRIASTTTGISLQAFRRNVFGLSVPSCSTRAAEVADRRRNGRVGVDLPGRSASLTWFASLPHWVSVWCFKRQLIYAGSLRYEFLPGNSLLSVAICLPTRGVGGDSQRAPAHGRSDRER